jgi:hypothetical protein
MSCGCGGRKAASLPTRTGNRGINVAMSNKGNLVVNNTPRSPVGLRQMAAQSKVAQQQAGEKSLGGMSKNRREIDRKRRLAILAKLGKF